MSLRHYDPVEIQSDTWNFSFSKDVCLHTHVHNRDQVCDPVIFLEDIALSCSEMESSKYCS